MRAIDGYDGWPTLRAALKFTALTFARPGEVRGALRREFDLKNAVWHISPERTKMRRPHEVPLSPQAIAVDPICAKAALGKCDEFSTPANRFYPR